MRIRVSLLSLILCQYRKFVDHVSLIVCLCFCPESFSLLSLSGWLLGASVVTTSPSASINVRRLEWFSEIPVHTLLQHLLQFSFLQACPARCAGRCCKCTCDSRQAAAMAAGERLCVRILWCPFPWGRHPSSICASIYIYIYMYMYI